jgi:hypothetical protein
MIKNFEPSIKLQLNLIYMRTYILQPNYGDSHRGGTESSDSPSGREFSLNEVHYRPRDCNMGSRAATKVNSLKFCNVLTSAV